METTDTDRRVRRTRHALQHALVELIVEKGYEPLTVQDILNRADVGRSTFYRHFRDKDDLLLSGFERFGPTLEQHRGVAVHGNGFIGDVPLEFLRHVAPRSRLFKQLFGNHRVGNMLMAHVQDSLANYAREVMQARLAGRTPAVPIEIVAHSAAGSFLALVRWWLQNDMPYTPEEMNEMFDSLITPGIQGTLGDESGRRGSRRPEPALTGP